MILLIQLILIAVLILILAALYIDEKLKKEIKTPTGRIIKVWDGAERRRFTRIACNILVRYCPPPRQESNIKTVNIKDVSIGGICMTISEKLSPHSRLCLEIDCGASLAPITASGEIVWIKEKAKEKNEEGIRYFNVGIEFKEMLPKDRERLFQFIKSSASAKNGQAQASETS